MARARDLCSLQCVHQTSVFVICLEKVLFNKHTTCKYTRLAFILQLNHIIVVQIISDVMESLLVISNPNLMVRQPRRRRSTP